MLGQPDAMKSSGPAGAIHRLGPIESLRKRSPSPVCPASPNTQLTRPEGELDGGEGDDHAPSVSEGPARSTSGISWVHHEEHNPPELVAIREKNKHRHEKKDKEKHHKHAKSKRKVLREAACAKSSRKERLRVRRFFLTFEPPSLSICWEEPQGIIAGKEHNVKCIPVQIEDLEDLSKIEKLTSRLIAEYSTLLVSKFQPQIQRLLLALAAKQLPIYRVTGGSVQLCTDIGEATAIEGVSNLPIGMLFLSIDRRRGPHGWLLRLASNGVSDRTHWYVQRSKDVQRCEPSLPEAEVWLKQAREFDNVSAQNGWVDTAILLRNAALVVAQIQRLCQG